MLLANPHLPWSDLSLWDEAQMTAPKFDAYGAALVGIPVLAIAFNNNNLGWTHPSFNKPDYLGLNSVYLPPKPSTIVRVLAINILW